MTTRPRNLLVLALIVTAPWASVRKARSAQAPGSTLIINAEVADGTGGPLRRASVRLSRDRIVQIGDLVAAAGDQVVDARGLVLAPGFIDVHNHSSGALANDPLAESQISQGITTAILGPDGSSPWPIGAWLDARRRDPAALNIALTVGHATLRQEVMGKDFKRPATPAEVDAMAKLVDQAMREGAIGLSSGLEYEVGSYSRTDEIVAMAAAAARYGGFYMTHIRDEADRAFEALDEEIAIGTRAHVAVEHSHMKLGTVAVWGKAPEYIRTIETARARGVDFLADCYPYDAWHSTIKVLVPNKQYEDPKSVEKALADVGGPSHVTISDFPVDPDYEGKTLAALATSHGITPVEMFIRIIREGDDAGTSAGVIAASMIESDIRAFYQQPWVMVASDGGIGMSHPRGAGTFPRVLGQFVRVKHWLSLTDAVRKMTSLPARRLGWTERGVIREGAFADLVVFDPKTVIDRATYAKPFELASGIEAVFVNGVMVWKAGRPTGARPGRVLGRRGA